jgi:hypothetical protein
MSLKEVMQARLFTEQEMQQMRLNWNYSQRLERVAECVASGGHERIATLDTQRGWHEGHCAKCGMNMDYDSGD